MPRRTRSGGGAGGIVVTTVILPCRRSLEKQWRRRVAGPVEEVPGYLPMRTLVELATLQGMLVLVFAFRAMEALGPAHGEPSLVALCHSSSDRQRLSVKKISRLSLDGNQKIVTGQHWLNFAKYRPTRFGHRPEGSTAALSCLEGRIQHLLCFLRKKYPFFVY